MKAENMKAGSIKTAWGLVKKIRKDFQKELQYFEESCIILFVARF
jgi:hypothetical protein